MSNAANKTMSFVIMYRLKDVVRKQRNNIITDMKEQKELKWSSFIIKGCESKFKFMSDFHSLSSTLAMSLDELRAQKQKTPVSRKLNSIRVSRKQELAKRGQIAKMKEIDLIQWKHYHTELKTCSHHPCTHLAWGFWEANVQIMWRWPAHARLLKCQQIDKKR